MTRKKWENNKYTWGYGENETLIHCWWKIKNDAVTLENSLAVPQRLILELPHNPLIPLPGMYQSEIKTHFHTQNLYMNALTWNELSDISPANMSLLGIGRELHFRTWSHGELWASHPRASEGGCKGKWCYEGDNKKKVYGFSLAESLQGKKPPSSSLAPLSLQGVRAPPCGLLTLIEVSGFFFFFFNKCL